MKCYRLVPTAGVLLLTLVLAAPLPAQTEPTEGSTQAGSKTNVLLTFRMGTIEGGKRTTVKSYTLIVAEGNQGSKLLAGERVPFPAWTAGDGSDGEGTQAFVYQNIGFSTSVRVWLVDTNRIEIVADIEDSRVRPSEDGTPPTVETRQLTVNAILTDGVPLELTQVEVVTRKTGFVETGFVEVEAKILR